VSTTASLHFSGSIRPAATGSWLNGFQPPIAETPPSSNRIETPCCNERNDLW